MGRHIGKALDLWQQNDISIVVNTKSAGYARFAFLTHGTTVCDIGWLLGDAKATLARAEHLGAVPFSQPLGAGEMDIPAIRGLSGSVLHFLDDASGLNDVLSVEFTPTHAAISEDAGLTRIDHLAQTMSDDEMLSWSLFYTTVFDMHRSPMVDVVDPDGLVRSQAIEAPDGALRITLNGAETHRTMAGSFWADSFGASVQHIALASDDLIATAARLAKLGFRRCRFSRITMPIW